MKVGQVEKGYSSPNFKKLLKIQTLPGFDPIKSEHSLNVIRAFSESKAVKNLCNNYDVVAIFSRSEKEFDKTFLAKMKLLIKPAQCKISQVKNSKNGILKKVMTFFKPDIWDKDAAVIEYIGKADIEPAVADERLRYKIQHLESEALLDEAQWRLEALNKKHSKFEENIETPDIKSRKEEYNAIINKLLS